MTKRGYAYIIPGRIINGGIRNNIPEVHMGKIKAGKDLISVEVKKSRISHHTRDRTSTAINRSVVRRHDNV